MRPMILIVCAAILFAAAVASAEPVRAPAKAEAKPVAAACQGSTCQLSVLAVIARHPVQAAGVLTAGAVYQTAKHVRKIVAAPAKLVTKIKQKRACRHCK